MSIIIRRSPPLYQLKFPPRITSSCAVLPHAWVGVYSGAVVGEAVQHESRIGAIESRLNLLTWMVCDSCGAALVTSRQQLAAGGLTNSATVKVSLSLEFSPQLVRRLAVAIAVLAPDMIAP